MNVYASIIHKKKDKVTSTWLEAKTPYKLVNPNYSIVEQLECNMKPSNVRIDVQSDNLYVNFECLSESVDESLIWTEVHASITEAWHTNVLILNDEPKNLDKQQLNMLFHNLKLEIYKKGWKDKKEIQPKSISARLLENLPIEIGFINIKMSNKDIINCKLYKENKQIILQISINDKLYYEESLKEAGIESDLYTVILLQYMRWMKENNIIVTSSRIRTKDGIFY